ncbi:E3 ubiquitin-protein ligase TRIM45-like [Saccostrea cucullata]|uniref:E3 ubiquitin-protein ligase TRIM45-like n=1 Tax=Saccostrea cuccullata TaxID=36930 RepID=UPI002ED69D46
MATPISWAQEVIICDICNTLAADLFCNSCQTKQCGNCINKHITANKLLPHDIVPFTNKYVKVVSQQCEMHPGQRYEACCRQRDVVVCIKCVIDSHKGHNIENIPAKFYDNMKTILKESEDLQKQLDLERLQSNTRKLNISKSTAEFEVLEGELEKHRKCWHQEVDDIFDKHKSLIMSMRENAIKSLTEQNHAPKHMIERKLQIIKDNKDIIRSKSVSKVVNYKTEFQEYKASPKEIDATVTVPSLKVKTDRGKELDIEFGELSATLAQRLHISETLKKPPCHLRQKCLEKAA